MEREAEEGKQKKIGCCNSKIYLRLRASDGIRT